MSSSFSVIIPAKNEEAFLPLLLESIKRQTLQPLEVIVADAGSTDGTVKLAKSYGAKVVKGGMPGVGRNKGARVAKGEILIFLDADVILDQKDFFAKAVKEFMAKEFDIATADLEPMTEKSVDIISHKIYNKYARLRGEKFPHAAGSFIMARKTIHKKIKGFDESITFCEDHDYAKRASNSGKFGFLSTVHVPVSTRRLDRDGRLRIAWKFLLGELHLNMLGPIRDDKFNYTFGHEIPPYDKK